MNQELPDVQVGFMKGRGIRDQIVNICWIIEKAREFQENIYCFIDYVKAFDCVDHKKLKNSLRDVNTRPPYLSPQKCVCRSRSKQQLEPDVEQSTGSKLTKEYIKAVCCHPAFFNLYAVYIMQNARVDGAQMEKP